MKCLFRFSLDAMSRLKQLQNPIAKTIIEARNNPTSQYDKLKSLLQQELSADIQIPLMTTIIQEGIMKDNLHVTRQLIAQYRDVIALTQGASTYHHDMADYYEHLALLQLRECKMAEAFDPFNKALDQFLKCEMSEYIVGRMDRLMESMVMVKEQLELLEDARTILKCGIQIFSEKLGKQSPPCVNYTIKLANTYINVDNDEAIKLYKQAIEQLGELSHENYPNYIKASIELMITSFKHQFDPKLYEFINNNINDYTVINPDLCIYYHIVMSHMQYEHKQIKQQEHHLREAFSIYNKSVEKPIELLQLIAMKAALIQDKMLLSVILGEMRHRQDPILSYAICRLQYAIDKQKGIEELKAYINKHQQDESIHSSVFEMAQLIHSDGFHQEAISLLSGFQNYDKIIKQWKK